MTVIFKRLSLFTLLFTLLAVFTVNASSQIDLNYLQGMYLVENGAGAAGKGATNWKFGEFKSPTKWQNQMAKRGWTPEQITEALQSNEVYEMVNNVNQGNQALRYVHPSTGKSVVIDTVTNEILQIGGEGFVW